MGTYAIPQRYGGISREPSDGPTEPAYAREWGEDPVDYFESCIHCTACSMQHERHEGRSDVTNDIMARYLGCGEGCECHKE